MKRLYAFLLTVSTLAIIALLSIYVIVPLVEQRYTVTITNVIVKTGNSYDTYSPESSFSFTANAPYNCSNLGVYSGQSDCHRYLTAVFWYDYSYSPSNISSVKATSGFTVVHAGYYDCKKAGCGLFPSYLQQGNVISTLGTPVMPAQVAARNFSELVVGVLLIMPNLDYNGPLDLTINP